MDAADELAITGVVMPCGVYQEPVGKMPEKYDFLVLAFVVFSSLSLIVWAMVDKLNSCTISSLQHKI